ncbi:MAG: phosphoribosylamine--glycine ligase, partial [Candidatus Latescibacterota bacterium]|nr:phosphoribosylamine--glycine ligase [Candidatus Latescibacterota bacterium]
MKILIVGKGGREHALAWKLAQSSRVDVLYAAPGSPGIAQHATCLPDFRVDLSAGDTRIGEQIDRLCEWAVGEHIDLTVVGPEDALAAGLVDRFSAAGLRCFGPTAAAARIESDKAFSKELMERIGVPTAAHRTFTDSDAAIDSVTAPGAPMVVKATGGAAGRGAIVAHTEREGETAVREMLE